MTLFLLAYLGGILTILSPCVLPVLPFVFARAGQPFRSSGLPLLLGMAFTFALLASIATLGGAAAVQANEYGRFAAVVLLALFGLTLLWDGLAERVMRPLVRLGGRLSEVAGTGNGFASSLLLGVATGLLWAPCAGPILGLLLTGAALQGASAATSLLLLVYAAGAATSLALALLAGRRVFALMKRSLGAEAWLRRGLGLAVLLGVGAIASGADKSILTRWSPVNTSSIEQSLLNTLRPETTANTKNIQLNVSGATHWLNSPPLSAEQLKGKVVLVDFWTYSCINCIRTLPYLRAWNEKYQAQGLVIIGVHSPEFAFEKSLPNVQQAMQDSGIRYPVALDNDFAIWRAFHNEYWPAHYLFDANGGLRDTHFGEGNYAETERQIQTLLAEKNGTAVTADRVKIVAQGAEISAATASNQRTPETYLGYEKAKNFVGSSPLLADKTLQYRAAEKLELHQWSLHGDWLQGAQMLTLQQAGGRVLLGFQARDVNLVLGAEAGKTVRFRVTLDGKPLGDNHGVDTDAEGLGVIRAQRVYQLIRQPDNQHPHRIEVEFLDAGAEAFAFTFG